MRQKPFDRASWKGGTVSSKPSLHVASATLCFRVQPTRTTTMSVGSKFTALTGTRSCGFKPWRMVASLAQNTSTMVLNSRRQRAPSLRIV